MFKLIPIDRLIIHDTITKPCNILPELIVSIKEKGLLQPLTVRLSKGYYQIIDGRQRYNICRLLGHSAIPCRIIKMTNEQVMEYNKIHRVGYEHTREIESDTPFITENKSHEQ